MSALYISKGSFPESLLRPSINFILSIQKSDGAIPWFKGGKTDPWDHIESAMGLSIGGEFDAAKAAYQWLADQQLDDGSWWANYDGEKIEEGHNSDELDRRESNFVAYCATGIWHHYLITRDKSFLQHFYPMVSRAIKFVIDLQAPSGEIYWAVNRDGSPRKDALVTACASIYKSLECAVNISAELEIPNARWLDARTQLGHTLRHKPECFDRTWESKARYSMDWFYPILCGVLDKHEAKKRFNLRWQEFVETDLGCRCVSDQPWVTVAESCELTMALLAAGERTQANEVFSWLHQYMDSDGGYWTGYVFPDKAFWPEEKTAWTAAAVLLAADALSGHTGAAELFTRVSLVEDAEEKLAAGQKA